LEGGGNIAFAIFGGFFVLIALIGFGYEGTKINKLRIQGKKFGASKLTVLSPSSIHLGDTVELQLFNKFLPKYLLDVNVVLRNIQEVWKKGRDNDTDHFSYLLYKDQQNVKVEGNTLHMKFHLPTNEVAPTDYTKTAPFYWELEISNEKENYHCIFYLEVKHL